VVVLLRKLLHPSIKIKASGGIKTLDFALSLIQAGAERLGTSSVDLLD
jgi:deoxyribose-phosphate aldolase